MSSAAEDHSTAPDGRRPPRPCRLLRHGPGGCGRPRRSGVGRSHPRVGAARRAVPARSPHCPSRSASAAGWRCSRDGSGRRPPTSRRSKMSCRSRVRAGCSAHPLPRRCCGTRGRASEEATRSGARRMMQDAHERGQGIAVDHGYAALTVLELGAGRYDAALRAARRVLDHDSVGVATLALADVVESAARCGEMGIAEQAAGTSVGTSRRVGDTVGVRDARSRPSARCQRRRGRRLLPVGARRAVALHDRDRDGTDAAAVRRVVAAGPASQGSARAAARGARLLRDRRRVRVRLACPRRARRDGRARAEPVGSC